ncbi:MAG: lysophospholipid acyltransferase family protein [Polyangiales bacterium]
MPSLRSVANAGTAVGWTVFMCSVAVPLYSVTRHRPTFQRMQRFWATSLARAWGMKVHAHGVEQLDPKGTYVFMANHLSHVDIVALFCGLPMNVGFLGKKELRRVPFIAQAMVAGGHVFIDRKTGTNAASTLTSAARTVAAGAPIVIFPEGTRGAREEIAPFKRGGFNLALQAGVPVVPVGLRGTRAIMGRERLTIEPGVVDVHVGAPVDPKSFASTALLSEHVRGEVGRLADMPLVTVNGKGASTARGTATAV